MIAEDNFCQHDMISDSTGSGGDPGDGCLLAMILLIACIAFSWFATYLADKLNETTPKKEIQLNENPK